MNPQCYSWPNYICKEPVTSRELLTPHVERFLAVIRSIEHQYVIMRRLCEMEQKYGSDMNGVTVREEPVLVAFSSFPEGIRGDPDDLNLVVVYNNDNWDASAAVNMLDRCVYLGRKTKNEDEDYRMQGVVENPKLYGMSGKNIKWAGIYHG